MEPLNDMLYRALCSKFPGVKIADQGNPGVFDHNPDWDRRGRQRLDVIDAGEYYRVNCPYCSDTRQRLWVNHRWGVYDPKMLIAV